MKAGEIHDRGTEGISKKSEVLGESFWTEDTSCTGKFIQPSRSTPAVRYKIDRGGRIFWMRERSQRMEAVVGSRRHESHWEIYSTVAQ